MKMNDKYTAEQVEGSASNAAGERRKMLFAFAAHLRERESAKAAVPDKIQDIFYSAFCDAGANACWDGSPGDLYHAAQKGLEAVAPMLASARVPDELMTLLDEMVSLHDRRQCVLTIHMDRLKELLPPAPKPEKE